MEDDINIVNHYQGNKYSIYSSVIYLNIRFYLITRLLSKLCKMKVIFWRCNLHLLSLNDVLLSVIERSIGKAKQLSVNGPFLWIAGLSVPEGLLL